MTTSIALFTVILASLLQSISGIGLALIAAPILVLIDPQYLPAPILSLGFTLSLLNSYKYRKHLELGETAVALYGRIPGTFGGIILLALLPQNTLSICFALLIISSVLLTYKQIQIEQNRRSLCIAGFLSGLMGTATSVGGPPIAMVYQNSDPYKARAQLSFYFLIGTAFSILILVTTQNFNFHQLKLTLYLLPAVVIGFIFSLLIGSKYQSKNLKPLISIISLCSAVAILIKSSL